MSAYTQKRMALFQQQQKVVVIGATKLIGDSPDVI